MKYYVLYNPIAGNGACSNKNENLKKLYGDNSLFFDVTKIDDYKDIVGKLSADDVLVISGGDGTLNRFINDTADINIENEILYFAAGSGNDFLRDIEGAKADEPFSLKKYIKDLPRVEVNGKTYRFINGVGYGVDGYCCEVGDKLRATSDKPVNYTGIAIKGVLFHFKPANAVVTVDGVKHEYKKVWIAPTMKGRYYGGGMMPTPAQDRLSDTHEVTAMVWHGIGKIRTLMAFPSIFKGEHIKHKKFVELHTGREISVEFDRPTALQIDGETIVGVMGYKVHA